MLKLFNTIVREALKNYLADFFCLGGTSSPYPLSGKSFCKKKTFAKAFFAKNSFLLVFFFLRRIRGYPLLTEHHFAKKKLKQDGW